MTLDVRIDGQYVASTPPADPGLDPNTPGGTPGYYQPGNPSGGSPATRFKFWQLNWFQESLRAVIVAAGLTPDRTLFTQLLTAIQTIVPTGNFLTKTDNLASLSNVATARANLGAGAANGLATLDSGGHVPSSQLPASVLGGLDFQGTWNASTNSPALASGVGTKGYYYKCNVAGATAIDGCSNWQVGDLIAFDGVAWDKIDGEADVVTSFNGRYGAVGLTAADVAGAVGSTTYDAYGAAAGAQSAAQTFATGAANAVTTALETYGAVGSYLMVENTTNQSANTTVSGSTIGQSGTWRCMGGLTLQSPYFAQIYVRIA